jgi:hypothetical protein
VARSTSKSGKGLKYTDVVKEVMGRLLPDARYDKDLSRGGSGPIPVFVLPGPTSMPRVTSRLEIQKGLHDQSFKINVHSAVRGQAVGDAETEYLVWIQGEFPHQPWVSYCNEAGLVSGLVQYVGRVPAELAGRERLLARLYPKLETLFGGLIDLYTRWFREEGAEIPPQEYRLLDRKESNTAFEPPAFIAFGAWLEQRGLGGIPWDNWRWWWEGRPKRAEEIDGDSRFNNFFRCDGCRKEYLRPVPCAREDSRYGRYYIPRCAKCASGSITPRVAR